MLKMRQTINLTGESVVDNTIVAGYNASIDSKNLDSVQFSSWINNTSLYKANRTACRADQAAFEDAVYAVQDEMIAEAGTDETATDDNEA